MFFKRSITTCSTLNNEDTFFRKISPSQGVLMEVKQHASHTANKKIKNLARATVGSRKTRIARISTPTKKFATKRVIRGPKLLRHNREESLPLSKSSVSKQRKLHENIKKKALIKNVPFSAKY